MRKTAFVVSFLFGGMFLLSSCIDILNNSVEGDGNVVTEKRDIGSFNSIEAETGLKVYVKFGEPTGVVEVEADENLQQYIRTELRGNTLVIKSDRSIHHARARDVYVSAGPLKEIRVSSAAQLKGQNRLDADMIELNVSSAGTLDLDMNAGTLHIDASSSGKMNLSGKARKLVASVSSAGQINGDDLEVTDCEADASSAGQMNLNITGELSATASSAGSIRYKGEPTVKKLESSSAGSISKH